MALSTEVDQLAKELLWLRREFDGVKSLVNGWSGGAGIDPYFNYLRARDMDIDSHEGFPGMFGLQTSGLNLPNETLVSISWTGAFGKKGRTWTWSSGVGQSSRIVPVKPDSNHIFVLMGNARFSSGSSVGTREVHAMDGAVQWTGTRIAAAQGGVHTDLPFIIPIRVFSTTIDIVLQAAQDSGTTMTLTDIRCFVGRFS